MKDRSCGALCLLCTPVLRRGGSDLYVSLIGALRGGRHRSRDRTIIYTNITTYLSTTEHQSAGQFALAGVNLVDSFLHCIASDPHCIFVFYLNTSSLPYTYGVSRTARTVHVFGNINIFPKLFSSGPDGGAKYSVGNSGVGDKGRIIPHFPRLPGTDTLGIRSRKACASSFKPAPRLTSGIQKDIRTSTTLIIILYYLYFHWKSASTTTTVFTAIDTEYLSHPQSCCPATAPEQRHVGVTTRVSGAINNCVPCASVKYHSDPVRPHRSIKTDGGERTDCEYTANNPMLQLQCRNPDIYGWGAYLSECVTAWVLTVVTSKQLILMLTCLRCASAGASPSNQNRFLPVSERIYCG